MKRRTFLLALGGGLAAAWWLKPGDRGGPHGAYFQPYNTLFRDSGPGRPLLFIDRQRLAANCRRLQQALPPGRAYRIVAKSLLSVPLIREVMAQTGTDRVMVFHQPFINAMAEAEPGCDLLLGNPCRCGRRPLGEELLEDAGFDPDRQLQWLIDSDARLKEYLELARRLDRRLRINVEIDAGLHRGGLTEPGQLDALLSASPPTPAISAFAGFMGYDAHVGKLPDLVESRYTSLRKAQAVYQSFIDRLYQVAPELREQPLTFNGAGSPTFTLHGDETPLNELAAGSCLIKPSDFDVPSLKDFEPAAFIAAPVLKKLDGLTLPGPLPLGDAWALWDPNRRRTLFHLRRLLESGAGVAAGHPPQHLYGASTNQMMYNGSPASELVPGDQLFFRPTQREFVLLQFGDLAAVSEHRIQAWWPPLPQGEGA